MIQTTLPAAAGPSANATSPLAPRAYLAGVWLAGGALAFLLCFYHFSATLIGGEFIPADHDSFYHARRIIAALGQPLSLMQFDPHIHAPEGSWVTWPWAFDTLMATLGTALMAVTGIEQPMRVLAFIAPAWVFVNAALLVAIGCRLGLGMPLLALTLLCFALSPLTRVLHRIGMLDHHFVEYSFVLAALWLGLRWFAEPGRWRAAAWCGALLGTAPAFHNGLFILQLPFLLTLFVLWGSSRTLPRMGSAAFAASLVGVTALFLLRSEPFLDGQFSFYVHSWFHLYIAASSALVAIALSLLPRRASSLALVIGGSVVLTLPILSQITQGGDFLRGAIIKYDAIVETHSVLRWIADGEFEQVNKLYSGLLWLLPAALVALVWQVPGHRDNADVFFVIVSVFGALLLALQFRLEYFGSFALYLGGCVLAQRHINARPRHTRTIIGALALIIAVAHITPLRALDEELPIGNDFQYMVLRDLFIGLGAACQETPGVVLAEHGDGHYITYHSACAVIADNFILTPQHQLKVLRSEALLAGTLDDVLARAPYVRYILVRRADNVLTATTCHPGCADNAGLREQLLGAGGLQMARLTLLSEMKVRRGDVLEPLARLFRVKHAAQSP